MTEVRKDDLPEIRITPEMVEAGQHCLDYLLDRATEPESGLMCIPEGWAEAVYRAMHGKRDRQPAVELSEAQS